MTDITVDPELTELEEFEPTRVDLVANPANGAPFLLMKSVVTQSSGANYPGCGCCANCESDTTKAAKDLSGSDSLTTDPQKDAEKASDDKTAAEDTSQKHDEIIKSDLFKAALAEAVRPFEDALKAVRDELAKVKETPIPGGPVQTVPTAIRDTRKRDESLAKAARYERMAEEVSEPDLRAHYQRVAEAARAAAAD